jgi:hypothetical protein
VAYVFYLDDYGPVTASVYDTDNKTPLLPMSGTATIVNQHTGEPVVTDAGCLVAEGSITYVIPEGSPITQASARYVAYMSAVIDATTKNTVAIPIDVLDKESYLIVDRWRRKVEFAAPDSAPDGTDPLSEAEGRDWIDQAVDFINRYYETGYTSTLASITPAPSSNDIEFIATVASLMARTAWWAGKGQWRDDEMAFNDSPFRVEWNRIFAILGQKKTGDWYEEYDGVFNYWDNYNRDRVFAPGVKIDATGYWWTTTGESDDEWPI